LLFFYQHIIRQYIRSTVQQNSFARHLAYWRVSAHPCISASVYQRTIIHHASRCSSRWSLYLLSLHLLSLHLGFV